MGCSHSHHLATAVNNQNKGQQYSSEVKIAVLELPLTDMQKYSIKKTWKKVQKQQNTVGARIFVRLFSKSEYLKAYFTHLAERDATVFRGRDMQALEAHGSAVLGVIDKAIQNIDDLSQVDELLKQVGTMHTNLPEYNRFIFWFIEEPFLHVVKTTIGEADFNSDTHEAYRWLICWVITRLGEEFSVADQAKRDARLAAKRAQRAHQQHNHD